MNKKCSKCGKDVADGFLSCPGCGSGIFVTDKKSTYVPSELSQERLKYSYGSEQEKAYQVGFIFLHLIAIFIFPLALFLTLPAHMIYHASIKKK